MAKMNKRVKKLWIEALKGGKYQQGAGRLRQGKGFCCLGVLCDLHAKETSGSWTYGVYLDSVSVLPIVVRDWAGLNRVNPDFGKSTASGHNDRGEKDFKQIANLIQRYL